MPSLHNEHESYKWWVLANVMIGTFIAVLDATIVNVGLPKITASLGTTVDNAEWVLTAYLLVFGVMLPASGWVADHFGYKRTYALGLVIFTSFSFLCGMSWNEKSLICMRIGQAIGGGRHGKTGLGEHGLEEQSHLPVVFDYKNTLHELPGFKGSFFNCPLDGPAEGREVERFGQKIAATAGGEAGFVPQMDLARA